MAMEPQDSALVAHVLSQYPFVAIEGVSNARTLGFYAVTSDARSGTDSMTRPNFLYRSADIHGITKKGASQMRDLGIKKVFDLRSEPEILKYHTEVREVNGVEIVSVPVFKSTDYSDTAMAARFERYSSDKIEAFVELYSEILDAGGLAYGTILRHIRDKPGEGCLIHCTAGKDRTAVIVAILFLIAGVDDEVIVNDYHLTEMGRAPDLENVMRRLNDMPYFAKNPDRALNMLRARREVMVAFLKLLREKYGGAEAYVKTICGLTDQDISTIRQNMLTPALRR